MNIKLGSPKSPNQSNHKIQEVRAELETYDHVEDEILVGWKGDASSILAQDGLQLLERFEFDQSKTDILHLRVSPERDLATTIAELRDNDLVDFAEGNQVIQLDEPSLSDYGGPDDLVEDLWGLHNTGQFGGKPGADIKVLKAWETSIGSRSQSSPIIAIHDTGMDMNHPDLMGNLWTNPDEIPDNGIDDDGNGVVDDIHGFNAVDRSGNPLDGNRHGTHVAGTIGAVGGNGEGITGVMQEARLMPIKIFTDEGRTSSDIIVRALQYSAKMGATITNNSFGARPSEAIRQAFAQHPALHIVAAGNRNSDNDRIDVFPANYELPNLLSVAATDRRDQKANFSNYGPFKVDLAAPGADIWSTFPGGGYTSMSGTSMAAPHVTGAAGLLRTAFPQLTTEQLKDRLLYSADRTDGLSKVSLSGGRLNVAQSMEIDTLSPLKPKSFRIQDIDSQGGLLKWIVPSEDGPEGGAASAIELRVSESPITSENYDEAALVASLGGSVVGATAETRYETMPGLSPRFAFFAAKAVDNVGNRSPLVSTSALLPAADLAFRDELNGLQTKFEKTGNFHFKYDSEFRTIASSAPREGHQNEPESLLTSPVIDLAGQKNSFLKFKAKTDLFWENEASIEVRSPGQAWKKVFHFEEVQNWKEQGVDLSAYAGKKLQFRFKVKSRWGEPRENLTLDRVELLVEAKED